ncbi:MAG: hypothetical protein N5P05_004239 (plasmid) [Chroococcopsis gigantea SAG 12.99]|jgi:hypothetical protein|nr:hypothetical protein [Chroococcopsis gigantea SAG 12.99]
MVAMTNITDSLKESLDHDTDTESDGHRLNPETEATQGLGFELFPDQLCPGGQIWQEIPPDFLPSRVRQKEAIAIYSYGEDRGDSQVA